MSKANPCIQFEMDVINRFQFASVNNINDETYLVIYLRGKETSYVKLFLTEAQLLHIEQAISLHLRHINRERERQEELV